MRTAITLRFELLNLLELLELLEVLELVFIFNSLKI